MASTTAPSRRRKLGQIQRNRALSAEERTRQILDERTERLAHRQDARAPEAEAPRVLVCDAGPERFGLPVAAVAEVLPARECMPVPGAPPALLGVFGRNGRLVSVIDLSAALGIGPPAGEASGHDVLLRRQQPQVALRVGRAHAVSAIVPLAGHEGGGFRQEAVTGYARVQSGFADPERILSLLDVDALLRPFLPASPVTGV
jgi:purine-binding chemotaxis protein CheW